MKFIRNISIFTLIISFFGSCATFSKKVTFKNQLILNKENVAKINGNYEIMSFKSIWRFEDLEPDLVENDSVNRFPLFMTLKTNQEYRNGSNENLENYKVKIEIQDKKIILISLLAEEKIVDNIRLNYKIKKDGYIYLKNKNFKTKWVPGLCGNFEINRIRIGINTENDLILNHSHYIYGAVLFIIGDTKKTSFGSEYKRKI